MKIGEYDYGFTVTICGSSKRFKDQMLEIYQDLSDMGYNVFLPVFEQKPARDVHFYTKIQLRKILKSDAILVANIDGYIGEGTKLEIAFAQLFNKEIFYLSDILPKYSNSQNDPAL